MKVLRFTASWCQPCKMIKPIFDELSNKYEDVLFISVNIDVLQNELPNSAMLNNITNIPEFHFIKNGKIIYKFSGCDANKLKNALEKCTFIK